MKGRKMSENNKRNPEHQYTTDLEYTYTSKRYFTPIWHDELPRFHLEFYGVAITPDNWPTLRETLDEWVQQNAGNPDLCHCAIRAWAEIQTGQVVTDEIKYPAEEELWFER
jgi:hypothetical protein